LITGGKGMLATDLTKHLTLTGKWDVVPLSRQELDITDGTALKGAMASLSPDLVVHTAAMHVDPCEEDPTSGFLTNAWATRNIARACDSGHAALVYVSTCGLFGDRLAAYAEYDSVVLKTAYARSKHAGEEFARQFCGKHYIVRPGWLFGGHVEHPKNFVAKRCEEARSKSVVQSVYDKHGSPTSTADLAGAIEQLVQTDEYGTYHIANTGGCSRAAYVRRIIECFGLRTPVEEIDSSHFPRKADVPDCEVLQCMNTAFIGMSPLRPWQDAIADYVDTLRKREGDH